jgi:nanoRNase/pAp phosphatase (c-di-AMP/oligoRNAs hydrolase)
MFEEHNHAPNLRATWGSTGESGMSSQPERYRLITRSDFDGLVCAMLFKDMGILDGIKFVHPKDVQDGKVQVTDRDILTNLPYVPGCHLCFDHHDSEEIRSSDEPAENHILTAGADSAARVVYDYFGGSERFPDVDLDMMDAVDKADAARFSRNDILAPKGWVLLSFLMDPRTGLGRFRDFRVSNYELMMNLIDDCKQLTIDRVLTEPDVAERVELYNAHREQFCDQIARCSTIRGNVVVLDLREEDIIFAGNRFVIYALYPEANASIHVIWGLNNRNTVLAIGKSILDRSNPNDVGEIALQYGGGGHSAAGTCQVSHGQSERVLDEIVEQLNAGAQASVTA